MSYLDDVFIPFDDYPGYQLMAPCMRHCADYLPFNGCDNSGCWCKKNNLDRRISSLTRCASTSCTFADMNTATDVDILSGIQVQYCVDHGLSPSDMTMPSTVLAKTTGSSSPSKTADSSSPSETGGTQSTGGASTQTGSTTRARPSSGPENMGGPSSSSTTTPTSSPSPSNNGMSTAAKAGIAVGAVFCALLAALICILLLRRRRRTPQFPPEYTHAPPPMVPSPAVQHPAPLHVQTQTPGFVSSKADVSPIDEKPSAFAVTRKEVGGDARGVTQEQAPVSQSVSPVPTEIAGSVPQARYEVHSDAPVGAHGGYQYQGNGPDGAQGRWVYEVSGTQRQGRGRDGAFELGSDR